MVDVDTARLTVRPLGPDTWPAWEALVARHGGVFGGCWCTWFHTMAAEKTRDADDNHALKRRLVAEDRAHAAVGYPHDLTGATKKVSSSFLYATTRSMFERVGFELERPKGQRNTVMRLVVPPA